jgi:multiple sugar transport system substrate-binding protein
VARRAVLGAGPGLLAAAGGVSLAACGLPTNTSGSAAPHAGTVPTGPVTLSYVNWFAPEGAQGILFRHASAVFGEQYPQVTVEEVKRTSGTMLEKFLSLAAAGTTPDLAALNPQFVEPLRARGMLADLTGYIKRDARTFKPDDFYEATRLRAIKDGKWHAIPLQMGLWFLLFNRTLLQHAGIRPPDASWSWDLYLEAVRAVKSQDAAVVGMAFPPYELPVRDNGGDVLSKDDTTCLLGQPAAYEAIQWIGDLRLKHQAVPAPGEITGQNARQLFTSGRYLFHIGDPGFLSHVQRTDPAFSWDIAVPPKGKVTRVSTVKGPSLVISADSRHKDVSWLWLGHYTGVEMQRHVAVEGKIVSARKSALQAFVDLDEGFSKKVLLDVAAMAKPMPYVAQYDEMNAEIQAGLDAVYTGEQPARAAMPEAARKVNLLLAAG